MQKAEKALSQKLEKDIQKIVEQNEEIKKQNEEILKKLNDKA